MREATANAADGQVIDVASMIRPSRMTTVIDRVIEPFSPALLAKRLEARQVANLHRVQMAYAAAYPSLARERAMGSLTSEEVELTGFSRWQLMLEGRDLYRNMPIIRAGVNGIARRAVGTGIKLQMSTDDQDFNAELLSQWADWCEQLDVSGQFDLDGLCRQLIRSAYTDGDLGLGLVDEDGDLRVMAVEGDRIAEDQRAGIQIDRHNPIGGVVVDWNTGRPMKYLVGRREGGGVLTKIDEWDADNFILFYRRQRVDQVRGVPLLAPVIQTARDLDKYMTATRIAANVQATFGVFIKRHNPAQLQLANSQAGAAAGEPHRTMPMKTGQIMFLAPDEDVTGFSPTMPAAQFDEVSKFWVRIIAVGMGATYESLMNDFTNMSFSSSKTHLLEVDAINREWQRMLVNRVLKRLFRVWVSKRMTPREDGGCGLLPFNPQVYDRASWIGPAAASVDPVADASANIELIEHDMLTLEDYHLSQGHNWRKKIAQRRIERAETKDLAGTECQPLVDTETPAKA